MYVFMYDLLNPHNATGAYMHKVPKLTDTYGSEGY